MSLTRYLRKHRSVMALFFESEHIDRIIECKGKWADCPSEIFACMAKNRLGEVMFAGMADQVCFEIYRLQVKIDLQDMFGHDVVSEDAVSLFKDIIGPVGMLHRERLKVVKRFLKITLARM